MTQQMTASLQNLHDQLSRLSDADLERNDGSGVVETVRQITEAKERNHENYHGDEGPRCGDRGNGDPEGKRDDDDHDEDDHDD